MVAEIRKSMHVHNLHSGSTLLQKRMSSWQFGGAGLTAFCSESLFDLFFYFFYFLWVRARAIAIVNSLPPFYSFYYTHDAPHNARRSFTKRDSRRSYRQPVPV